MPRNNKRVRLEEVTDEHIEPEAQVPILPIKPNSSSISRTSRSRYQHPSSSSSISKAASEDGIEGEETKNLLPKTDVMSTSSTDDTSSTNNTSSRKLRPRKRFRIL